MYEVKIAEKGEMKVTALVLHTTFEGNRQAEEIPPFFHRVMEEETLESVPDRANENQICAIVRDQDGQELDYYMGVETSTFDHTPQAMKTLTIPAAKYATAAFIKRGNPDVLNAFMFLTGQWIPENGYAQNQNAPVFIYYDEKFLPIYKEQGYAGNPVAEIYVPIAE